MFDLSTIVNGVLLGRLAVYLIKRQINATPAPPADFATELSAVKEDIQALEKSLYMDMDQGKGEGKGKDDAIVIKEEAHHDIDSYCRP